MIGLRNRQWIGSEYLWHRGLLFLLLALTCANCAFSQFVYVIDGSNNVSVSAVDAKTGALTAVPGSPFSAGLRPSGLASDPTSRFLFVANAGSNDVSAYAI